MRFIVASEVFTLFPGLWLPVAVAEGIYPTVDAPGIETLGLQITSPSRSPAPGHDRNGSLR